MNSTTPKIYLISRPLLIKEEVEKWLVSQGLKNYKLPETTSAAQLIMLAGRRCYKSFVPKLNKNVKKIRENIDEYIDNILASQHGSVLEHANFTFAIEGVSRVFTAEWNRHRAGAAISEGSLRYIRLNDNIEWVIPPSIRENEKDSEKLATKKRLTREIFHQSFLEQAENYKKLEKIWEEELDENSTFHNKKSITSMMRRIIGLGVSTGLVWSGNLRAIRHICTMRTAEPAEEEIQEVGIMLLEKMLTEELLFFKDFSKDQKGYYKPKYNKI